MNIVLLSDWETQQGGAAIAASRLAAALLRQGHAVTRIVLSPDGEAPPWERIHLAAPSWVWGLQRLASSAPGLNRIRQVVQRQLEKTLARLKPDLINVHNLHGSETIGGGFELVEVCARFAPLVWTLHDMWSFTGRCAYSGDCQRFLDGCDAGCPTHQQYPALEPGQIGPAWQRRSRFFKAHTDTCAVAPSAWMAHQARSGLWRQSRVVVIPNGLPLEVYQPLEKGAARRLLGLPEQGILLLAGAADLSDSRKGIDLLAPALQSINQDDLTLALMGKPAQQMERWPVRSVNLGFLADDRQKAAAYSAADLYVHPAREDNLPNTVVEAIACGTPVVALPVGGLAELVRPGSSGYLAAEASIEALADALQAAIQAVRAGSTPRHMCRQLAEREYADSLQAERYLALFEELVTI